MCSKTSGDADVGNRLVDTVGEGDGGKRERIVWITLSHVKETESGDLLGDTGSSTRYLVKT